MQWLQLRSVSIGEKSPSVELDVFLLLFLLLHCGFKVEGASQILIISFHFVAQLSELSTNSVLPIDYFVLFSDLCFYVFPSVELSYWCLFLLISGVKACNIVNGNGVL